MEVYIVQGASGDLKAFTAKSQAERYHTVHKCVGGIITVPVVKREYGKVKKTAGVKGEDLTEDSLFKLIRSIKDSTEIRDLVRGSKS